MTPDPASGDRIDAMRASLSREVTERHFRRRPELEKRYGVRGRMKCQEDAEFHVRYLAQSVALGAPELFAGYLAWAAVMLESRGIPVDDLLTDMAELQRLLAEQLPDAAQPVDRVVALATAGIGGGHLAPAVAMSPAAQRYLDAALREGPLEAAAVVDSLVASGLKPRDICVDVLQPAMEEAGRLWQTNRISVAEEHYCTAVTQRVLAKLYSDSMENRARGPVVVVACVSGELHEMGARMVSDLLSLEGYRTHYLGATMPATTIADYACAHDARVLALSASIAPHLSELRQAIQRVRGDPRCKDLRIMVGGAALNIVPTLWRTLGADGWAPNAAVALEEVARWV
jgi:methanogenic corrinoid protein MtbC1